MTASHDHPSPREGPAARYGLLLVRHRARFAILLALVTAVAIGGLFKLKFDSEPRAIFKQGDADFAQLEEYFRQFGADDNDIIIVLHGADLFSSEFSRAMRAFSRDLSRVDGVDTVLSILDVPTTENEPLLPPPGASPDQFNEARSRATQHPFLAGQIVSRSGNTMLVRVVLQKNDPQTISKISPVYYAVRDLTARAFVGTDVEASFAGSVVVRVETLGGVRREFFQIMALGMLIATLVAFALFRSIGTTLIVAAGPATAVVWTLGLMGFLGLDINGISTPLPSIIFVVAFANAVHLMLDIRRSRRADCTPADAARMAITHLGLACFLTSLTTAIGFGSLMLAETASVQRFGLATACGSFLGFFANLSVVPLLASRDNRPARGPAPVEDLADSNGLLAQIARLLLRLSALITVLAVLVTGVMLWAATQLKSDIVWTETLPADGEITRAMTRCDEEFGGALQAYVVVDWGPSRQFSDPEVIAVLREIESLVIADPTLTGPFSILNFIPSLAGESLRPEQLQYLPRQIPPAIRKRILRPDLGRGVLSMHLPNHGAAATRPAVHRLKRSLTALETQHPGFAMHLTGSAVVAADNMTSVIGDLMRSLSFASVSVFLVLTVALRSLRLGLLSLIPNAFPLLLNAGILYALDKPLQITSVLTFSICLGIAVDDTIHFMIKFLRERENGHNVHDAIVRAFQSVGLALLVTTAIVSGGFVATMTSSIPGLVFFGTLACTALVAALVGDLVILPAMLMRVLGRKERAAQRRLRRAARR